MAKPVLVDTSIWIDFFKGNESENVNLFCEYLENKYPLYICPTIIQEVLQGVKDEDEYKKVKDYLFTFDVLNDDAVESAIGAADIYRKLRLKGITIRKSNDCLIAYYAVKYNLKIMIKTGILTKSKNNIKTAYH